MTSALETARTQWREERPLFEALGREMAVLLRAEIRHAGLWADVTSRAKDTDSLIRKLIKKEGKHTYESLGDKAGVRVTVRYLNEIPIVLAVAERLFTCIDWENKVDTLGATTLGYLSTHGDARPMDGTPLAGKYPPDRYRVELQIRTLSQHLWSEMSHDSFYKNDSVLRSFPVSFQRRVYLLAGLIEIADEEFNRLGKEGAPMPEYEILRALEKHYFRYTTARGDTELSLDVIRLLYPLYGKPASQVMAHLDEFLETHSDTLAAAYDESGGEGGAFLRQPEALLLYDLLDLDEAATRRAWNAHFPERELERVANAFGISFD